MYELKDIKQSFNNLFPTKATFVLFVGYMALSMGLSIFVTNSQKGDHGYSYEVTTLVLIVELSKLTSAVMYYLCSGSSVRDLLKECYVNRKIMALYLIPSALYATYNNLAFVNLSSFDPTSYYLLLQMRVLVTGVIYQLLFSKALSRTQWAALCVLTLGCVFKQFDADVKTVHDVTAGPDATAAPVTHSVMAQMFSLLLVLTQIGCSSTAGVFNERLLKGHSGDVSLVMQNIFMYFDSSVVNLVVALASGRAGALGCTELGKILLHPPTLLVVANNTALGLVTAAFLKHLNSILKVFASAIEPSILSVICYFIFGYIVTPFTVLSIVLVGVALYIYSTSPLALPAQTSKTHPAEPSPSSKKAALFEEV